MGNGPDEAVDRPRGESSDPILSSNAKPGAASSCPPDPSPSPFPPRPHTTAPSDSPSTSDRPYESGPATPAVLESSPSASPFDSPYHAESRYESTPATDPLTPEHEGNVLTAVEEPPPTQTADPYSNPYPYPDDSGSPPPPPPSSGGGSGSDHPDPLEHDEDGGGPVKSFFEHLEDLRWVLVKSAVAIGIAVMLCLIAGNWLVGVIKWPLRMTTMPKPDARQTVSFTIGTNFLGTVYLPTNQWGPVNLGSNQDIVFELAPILVGTNQVFAFQAVPGQTSRGRTLEESIELLNLNPAGGFFVAFQVAIYGGLVLAAPFVLYFLADFIFPALRRIEKKYVKRGFLLGTGLFMMGVCFCYFVLMPLALRASVGYSEWLGFAANQWRAEEYISFVCKFMLGMGLGFELPIVVLTLVKIGLLTYAQLASFRKYMLVLNLVLGAVLTTPEVLTQVMMAIPLQILYEISVWIAYYWERQEAKRVAAETQA